MQLIREYHLKSLFSRELFEIYFLLGMRAFSLSLIGLFLPIYLYSELAYSLNGVIYFQLAFCIAFALFQFIATRVVSEFGAKHSMIASIPLFMASLTLIIFLKSYAFLFYPAAILLGLQAALFWVGFHVDAVLNGKKKNFGKESAIISSLTMLPSVIGPVLGAFLILLFSFNVLFIVALLVIAVSFIPLLFSKEVYSKHDLDIGAFFNKKHLKYFFGYLSQGMAHVAGGVFWPIFIFLILGSYVSLGIYGTIATFVVVIVTLILGKFSDEGNKSLIMRIAAIFNSLFWILKIFVSNLFQIFAIGSLRNLSSHAIDVPFLAKSYGKAKKNHQIGFLLYRETSLRIGQIFCLLLVLIFGNIKVAFGAAGVASLLFLLF